MQTNRTLLLAAAGLAALTLAGCGGGGNKASSENAVATNAVVGAGTSAVTAPNGDWTQVVVETPEGGYRMGNPNAPVKLIEYGSRTCPHCGHFAEEGEPALKKNYVATGKVSYEFRDFAIHAPDVAAILLGQCNGAQTFFPILEQMFANQDNVLSKLENIPTSITDSLKGKSVNEQAKIWGDYLGYTDFVGQRGVPQAKAEQCLSSKAATDALAKHMEEGQQKYNISGTPTFIVNGNVVTNAYDWKTLEPALKSALGS